VIVAATGPEPKVYSLVLSPQLAETSRGRTWLTDIASQAGFPEDRVFDITVALGPDVWGTGAIDLVSALSVVNVVMIGVGLAVAVRLGVSLHG